MMSFIISNSGLSCNCISGGCVVGKSCGRHPMWPNLSRGAPVEALLLSLSPITHSMKRPVSTYFIFTIYYTIPSLFLFSSLFSCLQIRYLSTQVQTKFLWTRTWFSILIFTTYDKIGILANLLTIIIKCSFSSSVWSA